MPSDLRWIVVCVGLAPWFHTMAAEPWGDLTGKVVVRFAMPPAAAAPLRVGAEQIADESLLVAADGGLINAVVWVRTPSIAVHRDLIAQSRPEVMMKITGRGAQPRVLPVWAGRQTVVVENQDSIGYNLNVQPLGDRAINPLLAPGTTAEFRPVRQQEVPVPVGCNIHSWLKAYLVPRENPYVAVTDTTGTFNLTKLPARNLELQFWHEKLGYLDTPQQPKGRLDVHVKPGQKDLGEIVIQR